MHVCVLHRLRLRWRRNRAQRGRLSLLRVASAVSASARPPSPPGPARPGPRVPMPHAPSPMSHVRAPLDAVADELVQRASQSIRRRSKDECKSVHEIALAAAIGTDDGREAVVKGANGLLADIRLEVAHVQTRDARRRHVDTGQGAAGAPGGRATRSPIADRRSPRTVRSRVPARARGRAFQTGAERGTVGPTGRERRDRTLRAARESHQRGCPNTLWNCL